MNSRAKAVFISHGGGPLPLLGDPAHDEMVKGLKRIADRINKPDAIVLVSAHWEEAIPTVTSGPTPELIYDYYGFPDESYEIQYPCLGHPQLASGLNHLLNDAGIESKLDQGRGFDHGMFVPLKIMYPDADIPCIQLSLVNSLDPEQHIKMGRALGSLYKKNTLLIGSGFSFHNMKAFFTDIPEARDLNHEFEQWLEETCTDSKLNEVDRTQKLIHWSSAPGAKFCHPREEHLLPLHVCYGVAQSVSDDWFKVSILDKESSMCIWYE